MGREFKPRSGHIKDYEIGNVTLYVFISPISLC